MTLYFDIETTGFAPSGRITCAATYLKGRSKVWATPGDDGGYAPMDEKTVLELVDFFEAEGDMGRQVVSYNGGSFDFHMLWLHVSDAEAKRRIEQLALNHFDLHLACILSRGHRIKLDSIAMASLGKVKTATGANAIDMWNKGDYSELFRYCVNDVELLRDLHELALSENKLTFESKKGNIFTFALADYMGLSADEMSKRSPKKEDWMGDNAGLVKVFDWIPSA